MIHLKNVSKHFKRQKKAVPVLADIHLKVDKGDTFGIIGYSGAGKSTLLRIMNGLESPSGGTAHVNSQQLNAISSRELRKVQQKTGMIFQHFNLLWSRTVSENVALPLEIAGVPRKVREEKVRALLSRVGLLEYKDVFPSQLSGGQKQRVGIARALANDPQVLLCDEATSALDTETTASIVHLLKEIHGELGITIVFVSHEIDVVRSLCKKVAVVEKGTIVESGDMEAIFSSPKHPVTKQLLKRIPLSRAGEQAC